METGTDRSDAAADVVVPLERDADGWPPYTTERLWASRLNDGTYQLRNTPVFACGVSFGDAVDADGDGDEVLFRSVARRSGYSTVRVFVKDDADVPVVEQTLRRLGCYTEVSRVRGLIAVSVPPAAPYPAVLAALARGAQERGWAYEESSTSPEHDAAAEAGSEEQVQAAGEAQAPWTCTIEAFLELARTGRLHRATGAPAPLRIGSGDTPLSLGESEGYSAADIAHFYVARRTRRWTDVPASTDSSVQLAYEEFVRDAIFEGKPVPDEIAAAVGIVPPTDAIPAGASVVPLPGNQTRWLAFSSRESAHTWLLSVREDVREQQRLRVERTGGGDCTRYWIVGETRTASLPPPRGT